jgi:hypothetical protein
VLKKHSDEELVDAILDVEFPVEDDEEPPFWSGGSCQRRRGW